MKQSGAVSAVIFDCDGVLVDSERLALEVELFMLKEIGLVYEQSEYRRRFLGIPYTTYLAMIAADLATRAGRTLPQDYDARLSARLRATYEERLQAVGGAQELTGALTLPKAVASSSKLSPLNWKLEHTGLKAHFGAHIYSTEHVARGKPEPDLFLFAAEQLCAQPTTTLVIEDSVNGVLAAKAAGMIAGGFVGGGHCAQGHADTLTSAGADIVFASHAEIGAFLGDKAG